ncbi:MAG: DUF2141 domain-containing protein [Kiritimatiellia bacterium]
MLFIDHPLHSIVQLSQQLGDFMDIVINTSAIIAVMLNELEKKKIMSESTHRKPALASTVSYPMTRVSMGVQCVALCAVLVFANLPSITFAQSSCPGIHVKIPNIKNSTGNITCGIFKAPEGFPNKFLESAKAIIIRKIQKTKAQCDFSNIPPGTYAIAVIHDENMNGELDTNWFGVPTEGYGFSKTTIDKFGAPAFSVASFQYDGQNTNLTIRLNY